MESETTITVRYECTATIGDRREGCPSKQGPLCSDCNKITTKTTKRAIPDCEKYVGDIGHWKEVWVQDATKGQRFFHGTKLWVPDPEGELPGDLIEQIVLGDMVPPHTDIHGCNDGGRVRFFVARVQ